MGRLPLRKHCMYRTPVRPFATLLVTVGMTAGLVGCGGRDKQVATTSTVPVETSTTTLPPPSTTTTTVAASTTTTAAAQPTTTVSRPKAVVAGQGDRVFAVFVATGDGLADPAFGVARSRLAELNYESSSSGETRCSQGAREALPQLKQFSLSVEFRTRAEAVRFAALYGRVVGTAAVKVFCAD